jgi:hypothetical protein
VHWLSVGPALAMPRQLPGPHATQDDAATYAVPPAENVPGPHASVALSTAPPGNVVGAVATGQKKPAGQGVVVEKVGQ